MLDGKGEGGGSGGGGNYGRMDDRSGGGGNDRPREKLRLRHAGRRYSVLKVSS